MGTYTYIYSYHRRSRYSSLAALVRVTWKPAKNVAFGLIQMTLQLLGGETCR